MFILQLYDYIIFAYYDLSWTFIYILSLFRQKHEVSNTFLYLMFLWGNIRSGHTRIFTVQSLNSTSCYNLRARRIRSLGSAVAGWCRFLVLLRAEVEWNGWNDIMQHS